MEVCKNRFSEKYFVLIEEREDKWLLIIPPGEIKLLDSSLFEEPIDIEERALLSQRLISDFQMKAGLESRKEKIIQKRTLVDNIPNNTPRDMGMVIFLFRVNKSFLEYSNHPITIPRQYHKDLVKEIYGGFGRKDQHVTVIPPNKRKLEGHIYYGVSGYGPYYQIKVLGKYPGDYFGHLQPDENVLVCIEKIDQGVDVWVVPTEKLS